MPIETQDAVNWALSQTYEDEFGYVYPVTKEDSSRVVDLVREYFNTNNIEYTTFSYSDLEPYLN